MMPSVSHLGQTRHLFDVLSISGFGTGLSVLVKGGGGGAEMAAPT